MDDERLKIALTHAADARKTEITLLWSRSLYFWGFIAVVLLSYGSALGSSEFTLAFLSACAGIILSLCWTLANRSSKYWQEVWEWKADFISESLLENKLFTTYHDANIDCTKWWGPKQFSPSKLAMAVSDMIVVIWAVLAIAALAQETSAARVVVDLIIAAAMISYAAYILRACRSGGAVSWSQLLTEIRNRARAWKKVPPHEGDF